MLSDGTVKVTKMQGETVVELVRLHEGSYFGERALITNEPRKANVIAVGHVECLVLERSNFTALLNEVQDMKWGTFKPVLTEAVIEHLKPIQDKYNNVMKDEAYLDQVLKQGAHNAEEVAEITLKNVKDRMGIHQW